MKYWARLTHMVRLIRTMGKADRNWLRTLTWRQRLHFWILTQRIRWAFARGYVGGLLSAKRGA